MSRLITFGCSHTYGHGLLDCWDPITNGPGLKSSNFAWPAVLGNLLNREIINNSRSGDANIGILKRMLEFDYENSDIVVVLWSYMDRDVIFHRKANLDEIVAPWNHKPHILDLIKIGNHFNSSLKTWICIHHAYLFLKSKNIKFFFVYVNNDRYFHEYRPSFTNEIKFLDTVFDDVIEYPKALDNRHTGEEGHAKFAELIYNEIINEINI